MSDARAPHETDEPTGRRRRTRREILRRGAAGGALCVLLGSGGIFPRRRADEGASTSVPPFALATLPVEILPELAREFTALAEGDLLSDHPTFRAYLAGHVFTPPPDFPTARSIVVAAVPNPLTEVAFHLDGEVHRILVPSGYVDHGFDIEVVRKRAAEMATKKGEGRIEAAALPLKLLAAHSGLGQYGKNNICFVPGMGSFHGLTAWYSDHEYPPTGRRALRPLRKCKGCSICIDACPTKCIDAVRFPIDAGKCITLYTEVPGEIPEWLDPRVHHALIGCVKCQYTCPANADLVGDRELIAEIGEDETMMLLLQDWRPELVSAVKAKLARLGLAADLRQLGRNLALWMDARA